MNSTPSDPSKRLKLAATLLLCVSFAAPASSQIGNPYPTWPKPVVHWTSADVGDVGTAGTTGSTGANLILAGSGEDIWNDADAFRFHHAPLAGDQQITVRVADVEKTDDWAKAGIMFRENLEAPARHVLLFVTPNNLVGLQWRETAGATPQFFDGGQTGLPVWLRLVRRGSTFLGYRSDDGNNWKLITPVTLELPHSATAGFAVTSHVAGKLCRATFDQVRLENVAWAPAPGAPGSLVATPAEAGKINLAWRDGATNETAFSIERSPDNTHFNPIATLGPNTASYTDDAGEKATAVYYRVRAIGANTPSAYSNVANAATGLATPAWSGRDIGPVGRAGSENIDGTTITLRAAGNDIWDNADAFRFVQRPLRGDGTLIARVTAFQNTNPWAKAGLMIRESLEPDAPNVYVLLTGEHGATFQWRESAGGATQFASSLPAQAPVWLRITRTGDTFTGYVSSDGAQWNQIGTRTIRMKPEAFIGFAATAHDATALGTATFTDIKSP